MPKADMTWYAALAIGLAAALMVAYRIRGM